MNIKNIHIIRGIASLIVVIYHSKFVLWAGGSEYTKIVGLHGLTDYALFGLDMLSSCGKQSVVLFFLLSAFVITHSFTKRARLPFREDQSNQNYIVCVVYLVLTKQLF